MAGNTLDNINNRCDNRLPKPSLLEWLASTYPPRSTPMQTCFAAISAQYGHLLSSAAGARRWRQWTLVSDELAACDGLPGAVVTARDGECGVEVLRAFLRLHLDGDTVASTVLLEILRPMLCRVSVYARTDRYDIATRREEQISRTLSAVVDVLVDVDDGGEHLGARIYFRTLSAVTRRRLVSVEDWVVDEVPESAAGGVDVDGSLDLTASSVIEWGLRCGALNGEDVAALRHVYLRASSVSIRAAAEEIGIPARRLESRVRRAVDKLRGCFVGNEEAMGSALNIVHDSLAA